MRAETTQRAKSQIRSRIAYAVSQIRERRRRRFSPLALLQGPVGSPPGWGWILRVGAQGSYARRIGYALGIGR